MFFCHDITVQPIRSQVPPAGFYATMDEDVDAKKQKLDPTLHGMELSKMEGRHVKEVHCSSPLLLSLLRDYCVTARLFEDIATLTYSFSDVSCELGGRPTESEGQESVEEAVQRERSFGHHKGLSPLASLRVYS